MRQFMAVEGGGTQSSSVVSSTDDAGPHGAGDILLLKVPVMILDLIKRQAWHALLVLARWFSTPLLRPYGQYKSRIMPGCNFHASWNFPPGWPVA